MRGLAYGLAPVAVRWEGDVAGSRARGDENMASGDTTRKGGNPTPVDGANQTPAKRGHNGGGRPPVDSKTRARVRKLAREGMSRNAIAREVGISSSTVTTICQAARPPISFDRRATKAATEARVADLKAERVKLAAKFSQRAAELLDLMDQPHTVVGWYEGVMSTGTIDRPTSADMKNYMTAAGIALDKTLAIERHDSDDTDLPAVDKFLAAMLGGAL